MKKILLLPLLIILFVISTKEAKSQTSVAPGCYNSIQPGYVECVKAEGSLNCGTDAESHNVCCTSGTTCPTGLGDTPRPYNTEPKCGVDTYQGRGTFCSVSAIGRDIVPDFDMSLCRNGEFCIAESFSVSCDQVKWDSENRNLEVCISGFPSAAGLTKMQAAAHLCNAGADKTCNRTPDTNITTQQSSNGYSGCATFSSISSQVDYVTVDFLERGSGGLIYLRCSKSNINTRGPDTPGLTTITGQQYSTTSAQNKPIPITCNGGSGIDTAIGCIPFGTTSSFFGFFFRWGVGIGGGIAFLLIVFAGFQIMTSRGDPNRLKAGQELLTSAIAGLVLLIFSIIILRTLGVDILKIPGF